MLAQPTTPKFVPRIRLTQKGAQLLDHLLDERYTSLLRIRYAARRAGVPNYSISPETTEIQRIRGELFALAQEKGWDLDGEPFGPYPEGAGAPLSTGTQG